LYALKNQKLPTPPAPAAKPCTKPGPFFALSSDRIRMEDIEMLKRTRLRTCLFLSAGALLGYLAASGNFRMGQEANAAPGIGLPGAVATQTAGR
jgi:hypothetical protein